jgi:hypothetical protein
LAGELRPSKFNYARLKKQAAATKSISTATPESKATAARFGEAELAATNSKTTTTAMEPARRRRYNSDGRVENFGF